MRIALLLLTIIAAIGVFSALAEHGANPTGNCDRIQADVIWDCKIDSGDQLGVAIHYGTRVSTYTPTNTPTLTPTHTPVPTATDTATPTATPEYTVAQLLEDTTGDHDGTLCSPIPASYDWGEHGRVNSQTNSLNQIASWGVAQWTSCGASQPNTILEVRNLRVYALADGTWQQYPNQNNPRNWCGDHLPDTFGYITACTQVGSNGWLMPEGQRSIHWAEGTDATFDNDACHLVLYEARKVGAGEIMAATGLDWRNGSSSAGDSWYGTYRLLTTDWEWIGGTSCTSTQLTNDPPPLP